MPTTVENEIRRIKQEQARRLEQEKYRFYVPTGKTEEFLNIVADPDIFIALYSAANGVGKTRCGANILAHMIWSVGNTYFKQDLFTNWPHPKNILIVSNHVTVEGTICKEIEDQFPKGKYKADKNSRNFNSQYTTDNGWNIDIMTYDQALDSFESSTRGLIWFDEPPPIDIFKACVARLRRGGKIMITATPLNMTSAWMYDAIIASPDAETKQHGKSAYVMADVESACKTHGIRGFLEHKDILNMIANYDDKDKQARIFGKFQHLVGLVLKMWNRKVHLIDPFTINRNEYVVAEYVDPHPRTPDAVLWVAIDRYGRHFVCNEFSCDGDTEALAEGIKDIRKMHGYRIISSKMDPLGFVVDKHTGESLASKLGEMGLDYSEASKNREYNNRMIAQMLSYQATGGKVAKPPRLYVFNNVRQLVYEIEHWQWDDWRGRSQETRGLKEKPMDKDDHMIENLGRICGDNLAWSERTTAPLYSPALNLDPYPSPSGSIMELDPYGR